MAGLLTYGYRLESWPSRFPSGTNWLLATRLQLRGQLRHWCARKKREPHRIPYYPSNGTIAERILWDRERDAIVFGFLSGAATKIARACAKRSTFRCANGLAPDQIDNALVSRLLSRRGDTMRWCLGIRCAVRWQIRNCPRNCDRGVFCSRTPLGNWEGRTESGNS